MKTSDPDPPETAMGSSPIEGSAHNGVMSEIPYPSVRTARNQASRPTTRAIPRVRCLGGARCVTGSKYLLQSHGVLTLIDCGLFQGRKELCLRNREPFPLPPSRLDQIILTHAHIDHAGYLPCLHRGGFRGPVYCTPATAALLELLLPDCGHLQEEDARYAAEHGFSKHSPPLPLFTCQDARACLGLLKPVIFGKYHVIKGGVVFRYHSTGHLLGAGNLKLRVGGVRLWFSGDLGRYDDPVMQGPAPPGMADYLFIKSTYGSKQHPPSDVGSELAGVIRRTADRRGCLLIPAFAIGRTQTLLCHIRRLEDEGRISRLPVYIDSPMAVDASALYCRFGCEQNLRLDLSMSDGRTCPLRCRETHFVRTVKESKALNDLSEPAIIISASGMAAGGRVLHHLANKLPDPRHTVLLAGYQAEGTRGRALLSGNSHLKIHGQMVPVRAEVSSLAGLSAHADQPSLLHWLEHLTHPLKGVFLVHGEEDGLKKLREAVRERFHWRTHIPEYMESIEFKHLPRPVHS